MAENTPEINGSLDPSKMSEAQKQTLSQSLANAERQAMMSRYSIYGIKENIDALCDPEHINMKEYLKKEILESHKTVVNEGTDLLLEMAEEMVSSKQSLFPYSNHKYEGHFDASLDATKGIYQDLRRQREYEGIDNTEAKNWVNLLSTNLEVQKTNYETLLALGVGTKWFFDGVKWIQYWMPDNRFNLSEKHYRRLFSKNFPGQEISDEKKNTLKISYQKSEHSPKVEKNADYVEDLMIDYSDENTYWRWAVCAENQWDPNLGVGKESFKDLSKVERKFIQELFMRSNGEDTYILNYYTLSDNAKNKNEYLSLMQALCEKKISREIETMPENLGIGQDGELILKLQTYVNEIKVRAKNIENNFNSDDLSLEEKIAKFTVQKGIVIDWGFFTVGELTWGWVYKNNSPYGSLENRRVDWGSLNLATDAFTVKYPWLHDFSYDRAARERTGLLPPTSKDFRDTVCLKENPNLPPRLSPDPDENLRKLLAFDDKLKGLIERLFNLTPKAKSDSEKYRMPDGAEYEIPENIKKILLSKCWVHKTPWKFHYNDKMAIIPVFASYREHHLNQWNVMSLSEKVNGRIIAAFEAMNKKLYKDIKNNAVSLRPSELDWGKIKSEPFDRFVVNIGQSGYIIPMKTDVLDRERLEKFFGSPSNIKIHNKRSDLYSRDNIEYVDYQGEKIFVPPVMTEIENTSFLTALQLASKYHIFSSERDTPPEKGSGKSNRDLYLEEGKMWLALNKWLPDYKGGDPDFPDNNPKLVKQYRETCAKLFEFYLGLFDMIGTYTNEGDETFISKVDKQIDDLQAVYLSNR